MIVRRFVRDFQPFYNELFIYFFTFCLDVPREDAPMGSDFEEAKIVSGYIHDPNQK